MKKIVTYPGTFDPITNGHLEIIERASKIFDEVAVLVAKRDEKNTLFSLDERIEIVKSCVTHIKNVKVDKLDKLLVDYLKEHKINLVLRGLRSYKDFEYEKEMFEANITMLKDLEIIFMIATPHTAFISSSLIKEIALNGGDVSQFVPKEVNKRLKEKLRR
ncbi:pantetheine-phosphate adenylyltransferase [Caldisericum exile]|uniref:Phosphopantetheine adenylyltransferase n=1 Tax=Caldisericum exile (strain DSM 21853 / NBRC 104410 / AZM16c01) TaxID=511051 RepID=A0A7U6JG19_CALEA|nr:pantetheine-phosphate adenylyltransferase [Caldisericum exile]BAL81124.1 phosphopantetheine adenylyltransferase [Caldisericum exile AZM16c01]